MALFSIPRDDAKFGVTPVDNLFIQEYMLSAPGDYVKVYLYALMQARHPAAAESTAEKFAASLSMEPEAVQEALRYWQRHGLIRQRENGLELTDVRNAMCDGTAIHERMLYQYAALNAELDRITGGRAFTNTELNTIYDWMEVLRLSEEAVAVLIEYCVKEKGKKFRIQYAATIAREWEKTGIRTGQDALNYLLFASPANKVVADFGYKRRATIDEHRLYEKWTKEWGFTHDGIAAARETMTGVANPNFKYLDKVLSGLYNRGMNTAHKIRTGGEEQNAAKALAQECAFALGVNTVTNEHIATYQRWTQEYGMPHDAIVLACRKASARNEGSFKGAETLIASYARRKLKTAEEIEQDSRLESDLLRVYEAAGMANAPNERDKAQLSSWLSAGVSHELILQAAEYAAGSDRPFAFLAAVLKNWKEQNITSVSAARKEHDARLAANREQNAANKTVSRVQADPRKKEDLESLFEQYGAEES